MSHVPKEEENKNVDVFRFPYDLFFQLGSPGGSVEEISGGALLLETGDFLLLEDGVSKLLLE